MTDNEGRTTNTDATENGGSQTAVAESAEQKQKLAIDVAVEDAGPCKKHVRVTVPRDDISRVYEEEVGELVTTAEVPGFRVGHVPEKLVERRFRKELGEKVKQRLLMESLEQLSEEKQLDPINEPNLDVEAVEVPEEGDFEYEFDIEVRPEFDLPDYKGLELERPVKQITDEQVEATVQRYVSQYGEMKTLQGPAEKGDHVTVNVAFSHNGKPLRKLHDLTVQIKPVLRFQDAELEGFDELMCGVTAGQTREADLKVSTEAESLEMRGEDVHAVFNVKQVRRLEMPELNSGMLTRIGVESEQELRDEVRNMLERQAVYQQRQAVRRQVLDKITESADWDLPEDLVRKQMENALRREVLEMQQAGFTRQQIQARENELRQRAVTTTRQALKEHFVLDKIATQENIEVEPIDIDQEIISMAFQQGESPRRVRARLQKSGMIENLEAQIRERKAVDHILEHASFKDVAPDETGEEEGRVEAVGRSVCAPAPVEAGEPAAEEAGEADQGTAE